MVKKVILIHLDSLQGQCVSLLLRSDRVGKEKKGIVCLCMCVGTCVCVYACECIYLRACMCVCVCVCVCVCMCMCDCVGYPGGTREGETVWGSRLLKPFDLAECLNSLCLLPQIV